MNATTASRSHNSVPLRATRKRITIKKSVVPGVPELVNGDALDANEFMRRYEASPDIRKAELIDGIVYIMSSPVSISHHGEPDILMHTLLCMYGIETPGVRASAEATVRLGTKNVPQPDASLRYLPERKGNSRISSDDYLEGSPELIVEISASSASIDTHKKFDAYQSAGVREYIIVLTKVPEVKWWYLDDRTYQPLPPDEDGILRSRVFPGLWLDPKALLKGDGKRVLAVLRKGLKSKEHAAFAKLVS